MNALTSHDVPEKRYMARSKAVVNVTISGGAISASTGKTVIYNRDDRHHASANRQFRQHTPQPALEVTCKRMHQG